MGKKNVVRKQHNNEADMCVVQNGDKQLLIVTGGAHTSGGVYAFNTETDELAWTVKGELEGTEEEMGAYGVTTDGRGHLFVCAPWDNECIQMFSVRDGARMGAVMRQGEHDMEDRT